MQFGTVIEYKGDGDKAEQTITYYRGGKAMKEYRRTVIEKRRVANQLEEAAEYHSFSKRYHQDPTILDPSVQIEGKEQWHKGKKEYYYVVLSYMQVEDS